MKIYSKNHLTWVTVYRDTVEEYTDPQEYENAPCIELLVPTSTLIMFLCDKGMSWDYFKNESLTEDFNEFYDYAKDKVILARYCE